MSQRAVAFSRKRFGNRLPLRKATIYTRSTERRQHFRSFQKFRRSSIKKPLKKLKRNPPPKKIDKEAASPCPQLVEDVLRLIFSYVSSRADQWSLSRVCKLWSRVALRNLGLTPDILSLPTLLHRHHFHCWLLEPSLNVGYEDYHKISNLVKPSHISKFSEVLSRRIRICQFSSDYNFEESLVDVFDKNNDYIATYRFRNNKFYDDFASRSLRIFDTSGGVPHFNVEVNFGKGYSSIFAHYMWDEGFNGDWKKHIAVFETMFDERERRENEWTFTEFVFVLFHALSYDPKIIYVNTVGAYWDECNDYLYEFY